MNGLSIARAVSRMRCLSDFFIFLPLIFASGQNCSNSALSVRGIQSTRPGRVTPDQATFPTSFMPWRE